MDSTSIPGVDAIDGGYVVAGKTGDLKVFPVGGSWAVFFARSTRDDLHPQFGIPGSMSATPDLAIEWAQR